MQSKPIPLAYRAALRARVAACLRAQRGDTLIEVLVAALLVALIATASLTGFGAVNGIAGNQRNEEQAATLAQQDQARLRGLTITQLSGALGNNGPTGGVNTMIDGTTYTVVSKSQFISGASGAASCSTSGATGNADEVQTTSTVTWGSSSNNGGRPPVVVHGLITPAQGGSLVVSAQTPSSTSGTGYTGLAGVTATVAGPTTVSPLTTDSNGCAVFAGLAGGTYTVTYSDPGYVDKNGNPPASWSGAVTSTQTVTATPLLLAQDGAISATFTTVFNGSLQPATSDTFVASNSVAGIAPRVFGTDSSPTNNAYSSTIVSPTTVFPFTSAYSAYAGTCNSNSWSTTPAPPTVTVNPGATNSVVIPEPAMIVLVWGPGSYDDTNSAIALSGTWSRVTGQSADHNGTETTSSTANSSATVTFTGTSVQWLGTTGPNNGQATVSIDGGAATTVDTYSSSTQYQQLVYTVTGLSSGSHTLKIVALGTHDSSSGGNLISIDAITLLLTTKPNVTVTDTDTGCTANEDYPLEQIPTTTQGALLSPGEPYGNYSVCADNGTNHNTATVANTNFLAGNVVNIYLASGSAGLASGACP
jgi:Tfp pilus assembly protein PilV